MGFCFLHSQCLLLAGQAPLSGHLSLTPLVTSYKNLSCKKPAPVTHTFLHPEGVHLQELQQYICSCKQTPFQSECSVMTPNPYPPPPKHIKTLHFSLTKKHLSSATHKHHSLTFCERTPLMSGQSAVDVPITYKRCTFNLPFQN